MNELEKLAQSDKFIELISHPLTMIVTVSQVMEKLTIVLF
jgi:hypothetical protein